MHHMPHNNGSTICRSGNNVCMVYALESFADKEGHPGTEVEKCQCYPLCNEVQYGAETLKTKFDFDRYLQAASPTQLAGRIKYTHLEFYHKEPRFVSMRRSELFGLTDFLANCGGLLGLFLGFSFLSLVEIFYFCTLRLGCTFRREIQKADFTSTKIENRF
ncbi:pickpocket protein 28-like [Choristoneura fumiferana]|uniref:pickpocket protein 28-like n=1 Tax=Choristoneura fumiferana TaxID=7141 RepID=UPI003D1579AA